jgi:hypothetical protein
VGRAQEKAKVFRTERRTNPLTGSRYPFIVVSAAMVNQFYFYGIDDDFGPFFIKFSTYFPYSAKCCINVHHWAQRQARKAGIGFEALDNGFASCEDPSALAAICCRFGPSHVEAFITKWLTRLPRPLSSDDRAAGYDYDISVLQAEFALTQVLDRPLSGRVFFEEVIRDNLDAGRADQVSLSFERRVRTRGKAPTPSRFRTRVLTAGVTPSLHVDYKHSKIKQYFKEGRAIRPRPRSTTPPTSVWVADCTTCLPWQPSASKPTDAYKALNEPAVTPLPEPPPMRRCADRSSTTTSACPPCASIIPSPRRCWSPWWCSVPTRMASPTESCERPSPPCSATSRTL